MSKSYRRANKEVQDGCDQIPNLVMACHCGDDCPELGTAEQVRALRAAVKALEEHSTQTMDAERNTAIDAIEEMIDLDSSACPACSHCADFTWTRCDTCDGLAGARHALAQIFPGTTEEPIYFSSCSDCMVYVANGELPED